MIHRLKVVKAAGKRRLLLLSIVCFLILFFSSLLLLWLLPWPELDSFLERQHSSRFYDREGELVYILSLEEGLRREWTDLEKIPKDLIETFIRSEDKNFINIVELIFLHLQELYFKMPHQVSG